MNTALTYLAWPVLAYLIGSIPSGLIIVRCTCRTDIRRRGSGNIGATNVRRISGTGWAVMTLLFDVLKGLLPTLGAISLAGSPEHWLPAASALAAIAGHMFPAYLKFEPSGKGVATAFGAFLMLAPVASLIALLAFILTVRKFRRVSVGSLIAVAVLPPGVWFSLQAPLPTVCALVAMVLVIRRHEDNLRRLADGTEPSLDRR